MYSPITKVSTTKPEPMPTSIFSIRPVERPDTRMTVLGMTGQGRERVEGPDQDGDGQQLVDPARYQQQDVDHGLMQLVSTLADAIQLVDEIEETEQAKKGHQDHARCAVDLPREMADDDLHAALRRQKRKTDKRR